MPIHGDGGHAAVVRELNMTSDGWIVAIGDNATRKRESSRYTDFAKGFHPSAVVSPTATIGVGTVILENAVVQARAVIGCHVIVNCGAVIAHDCVIGDFAHIAPGVHLCGGVKVGIGALVGVGSCAIPRAVIGAWDIIGAGSVVK